MGMKFGGQLVEADYVRAQWLHMRPRRGFAAVGLGITGMFCRAIAMKPGAVPIVLLGLIAAYFLLHLPRQMKSGFRHHKGLHTPITGEVKSDGIYSQNEHGAGPLIWGHILKWRFNKRIALVYPSQSTFFMLPSRYFESEDDFRQFLGLLQIKVGKPF
jgi:hypothetical protein